MEDSAPILKNGHGQPYVSIFGPDERPIMIPSPNVGLEDQPLGTFVTKFEYNYNEEDDDTAEITLEIGDPDVIDHPYLRNQMALILQWGYLFEDGTHESSPTRKVVIRDHNVNFSATGVRIVLHCTDAFALTKMSQAELEERAFYQWLKNNVTGKFTVDFIDFNDKPELLVEKIGEGTIYGRNGLP